MPNAPTVSISDSAWEAFSVAALIRDSLVWHGADSAEGVTLSGDTQEAIMLSLDRLVSLARSIAISAETAATPALPLLKG